MKESKAIKALAMAGKIFIGVSLMAMTLMTFVNAVDRYVFKDNVQAFEELSRYLFVWVAFLGAMLGYSEGRLVGVDIVVEALHGVTKLICKILAEVCILGCVGLLLHGSLVYFKLTYADPSPGTGIPYGMVSGMAIVLSVYFVIVTLRDIVVAFKDYKAGRFDKDYVAEGGDK